MKTGREKNVQYKIRNMKQQTVTLRYNLKSAGNNVRVHRAIWRQKLNLTVAEDGGALAVVSQTRDAICYQRCYLLSDMQSVIRDLSATQEEVCRTW